MSKQDNKSQFDMGMTLKKAHQDQIQALRVIDVKNYVQDYYSRVLPVYNAEGSVVSAKFYQDNTRQTSKIIFIANNANVLLSKYFLINSGGNRKKFYVWFDNAANTGIDPAVPGRVGVRVEIENGDPASIVGFAVASALKLTQEFYCTTNGYTPVLEVANVEKGYTDPILAGTSGFTVSVLIPGQSNLIKEVILQQVPNCKYVYNELEACFELISIGAVIFDQNGNIITSTSAYGKQALDIMPADQPLWDEILTTFPTTTTELFTYKLDTVTTQTVLVTYVDASKRVILKVEKTRF